MRAEGVPVDDFGRIVGSLIDAWEQMPNDLRDERLDRRMGDLVTYMEKRPAPAHPAAASAEREAQLDTVDALLDAVRKFVKKDTPTGLMRLNDAMVAAREAVAAARATKEL